MAKMRNIIKSTAEYTEAFSSFRGIAPEGDNSVKSRLAYSRNMYRDYEGDCPGAIVSLPGYRRLTDAAGDVDYLLSDGEVLIFTSGGGLYFTDTKSEKPASVKIADLAEPIRTHFRFGEHIYFTAGDRLYRLIKSEDGYTLSVPEPHVPLLFRNGVRIEARNLLTDLATEEFDIIDARENATETDGLSYGITDDENFLCSLIGADPSLSGEVSIPGFKKIGDFTYRVDEIGAEAFKNNTGITSVRIGEGVRRIRRMAFYGCSSLGTVSTPATLSGIDAAAFNSCVSLTDIYLRSGLSYIENAAFAASYNIERVYYEAGEGDFALIAGREALAAATKIYNTVDSSLSVSFPLSGGFETLDGVTVDGKAVDYTTVTKDGKPTAISLTLNPSWKYNGCLMQVSGRLPELYSDFNGGRGQGGISARGIVESSSICATYDGRVFLGGSARLPATVFYSSRTRNGDICPTYFGEYDYFTDGTPSSPTVSLLSVGGGLYVFKAKGDPMGEIFLHIGEDTGDSVLPRIYPVTEAFSGESAIGATFAAADGPIFLSARGLSAIEKRSTNLERSITVRSSNIQTHLLRENLSQARIFDWMGYIAVAVGEKIFLADPRATFVGRSGNIEYEWFIVDGVGCYIGKSQVFRYASYKTHPVFSIREDMADEIVTEYVSRYTGTDRTYYAVHIGDVSYAVYPTDEYTYTDFIPAQHYCMAGDALAFTAGGGIYLFNNTRRGVPPTADYLSERGITAQEYREAYGDRLHPSYYSFDGVAPRYVLRTVKTDCGVPHLTKSSVKSSLTVKLGAATSAMPSLSVTTDRGEYSEFVNIGGSCLDFIEFDFASLALCPEMDHTVAVAEKEKGWVEKDIAIYSDMPSAPLSVMGIAFRYKIKGRIKHT